MKFNNKFTPPPSALIYSFSSSEPPVSRPSWGDTLKLSFLSALTAALMLIALFYWKGLAPFGGISLAYWDANIQYLDFYAWYKDVLEGKDSLLYSPRKGLGAESFALFAYYLSSPFALLVKFFPKTRLHEFFDIIYILKMICAAAAMCCFLSQRFSVSLADRRSCVLTLLLSLSYVFSQYAYSQASNIMWLDGFYMLPLMLLGVHFCVTGRGVVFLAVTTGLAIIFNWYSAGMNCLFTGLWFLLEVTLLHYGSASTSEPEDPCKNPVLRRAVRAGLNYAVAMIVGVALGGCVLYPAARVMSATGRGTFHLLNGFKDISFVGEMPSDLTAYVFGAASEFGAVSLFCGTLVILGVISHFLSKIVESREKWILGGFLILVLLIFHFRPLHFSFSLFQPVWSYWYRDSYLGIFALIFLASFYLLRYATIEPRHDLYLCAALVFAGLLIVLSFKEQGRDLQAMYRTAIAAIISAALLAACHLSLGRGGRAGALLLALLTVYTMGEQGYSAGKYLARWHNDRVVERRQYTGEAIRIAEYLAAHDEDVYRVTQTGTFGMSDQLITANYDEGLAYGYRPLTQYTSMPEERQARFLDLAGYRYEGATMNIVTLCQMGIDSFLGVKYVISDHKIPGLRETAFKPQGKRALYENPYVFPQAFAVAPEAATDVVQDTPGNPFEFQNTLIAETTGVRNVLVPNPFEKSEDQDGFIYRLEDCGQDSPLYGNIVITSKGDSHVKIDDKRSVLYSRWLSPSVFYIPPSAGGNTVRYELPKERRSHVREAQFYRVDLKALERASAVARSRGAEVIRYESTSFELARSSPANEKLLVTVPYTKRFKVSVNGRQIDPEIYRDCFYLLPLQEGENRIRFEFDPKDNLLSGMVSGATLLLIMLWTARCRRSRRLTAFGLFHAVKPDPRGENA